MMAPPNALRKYHPLWADGHITYQGGQLCAFAPRHAGPCAGEAAAPVLWRQAPASGTVCAKGGNNDTGAGGGWFKPTGIRFVTGEINSLDKKLTRATYLKLAHDTNPHKISYKLNV